MAFSLYVYMVVTPTLGNEFRVFFIHDKNNEEVQTGICLKFWTYSLVYIIATIPCIFVF